MPNSKVLDPVIFHIININLKPVFCFLYKSILLIFTSLLKCTFYLIYIFSAFLTVLQGFNQSHLFPQSFTLCLIIIFIKYQISLKGASIMALDYTLTLNGQVILPRSN